MLEMCSRNRKLLKYTVLEQFLVTCNYKKMKGKTNRAILLTSVGTGVDGRVTPLTACVHELLDGALRLMECFYSSCS